MPHEVVTDDFVLFWKGQLSQWHPTPFVVDDIIYPTAEHWMMARKASLFKDTETLNKILLTSSPKEAKDFGRQVRNFDDYIWNKNCYDIVVEGNVYKFNQNKKAMDHLINTGKRILVEASPYDNIWGIGLGQDNAIALNPCLWPGKNLLGLALMSVRSKHC
jgi:ribA/ribD-fused uncharacterized protein